MDFGSGLVGWAAVPEELIEGGTGADRMCDQCFDGDGCLVSVHVQLCRIRPIAPRSRFGTSGRSGMRHLLYFRLTGFVYFLFIWLSDGSVSLRCTLSISVAR